MNRLLSILVTLFILFLVYLWINHLMGNAQKSPDPATVVDGTNTEQPAEEYDSHDEEEDTAPGELITANEIPEKQPEPVQPVPVQDEPEKNVVRTPRETPAKTQDAPTDNPPPEGAHLVIAGNFLERANAEERVKELRKLGYSKAEVVNFELSEYHTACAGRYKDLNEARRVAKKIKDQHHIDTYVRHGN